MAENTLIEWSDNTWNPWKGCHKVSAECANCYIGPHLKWTGGMKNPFSGPVRAKSTWANPRRWNERAQRARKPEKTFCASLTDFFHEMADEWRDEAWDIIRECTWLDWQILTKRPNLVAERLPDDWGRGWPHVWLGVTCGCEDSLWRLDALRHLPAQTRFVSAEPLLGPVNFGNKLRWIDWLITGCEKCGEEKRRPMDLEWVRDIDTQCRRYGVAHFFKQYYLEGTNTITKDGRLDGKVIREFPRNLPTVPGRTMTSVERAVRKRPRPKRHSKAPPHSSVADLLAAKNFIAECGGIERAKSAIDVIGRLQSS